MSAERRKPTGSGFGESGGTNVEAYFEFAEQIQEVGAEVDSGERIVQLSVALIDPSPYQVRIDFDQDQITGLGEDIKRNGLSQPVTVRRKRNGRYELVAGERRWRAVKVAALDTIEVRVRDLDDFEAHLVGVSENNQRADLSPWEKALETLELQRHAEAAGRPHAQRDLATYLNRNIAIVNQQLAIASAFPSEVPAHVDIASGDFCRLPHETLHKIARLQAAERPRALEEAIRNQVARKPTASDDRTAKAGGTRRPAEEVPDRWTRLWETGGFQMHIRKPIRDLEPARAHRYITDLLPGIGALAARAVQENGCGALVQWQDERGRVLFLRPVSELTREQREEAVELLAGVIADLQVGK
jgi:ParB/RepB/Spo0J family partition protein